MPTPNHCPTKKSIHAGNIEEKYPYKNIKFGYPQFNRISKTFGMRNSTDLLRPCFCENASPSKLKLFDHFKLKFSTDSFSLEYTGILIM